MPTVKTVHSTSRHLLLDESNFPIGALFDCQYDSLQLMIDVLSSMSDYLAFVRDNQSTPGNMSGADAITAITKAWATVAAAQAVPRL